MPPHLDFDLSTGEKSLSRYYLTSHLLIPRYRIYQHTKQTYTMSFTVSSAPNEDEATIRALLHANLISVFNERDETARRDAIQSTYTDDITWYESTGDVFRGHDALNKRAGEILDGGPGFSMQPEGEVVICQNLGTLNWRFGPPEQPDLVKGTDVILVRDGRVQALWTAITKIPA